MESVMLLSKGGLRFVLSLFLSLCIFDAAAQSDNGYPSQHVMASHDGEQCNNGHEESVDSPGYFEAEVDGLNYTFFLDDHTASIENGNCWDGELSIPATVNYAGESYTVNAILWLGFVGCQTLTKVTLPATLQKIDHVAGEKMFKNIFWRSSHLQTIDVDEANPWFCAKDGVLYNKAVTELYAYPAAAERTAYVVPASVTWIGYSVFADCVNLKELVIEGVLDDDVMQYNNMFAAMSTDVILYVQASEVEKFKAVYKGTVLPLDSYDPAGISDSRLATQSAATQPVFDLQGRPQRQKLQRGIYVEKGRKHVK